MMNGFHVRKRVLEIRVKGKVEEGQQGKGLDDGGGRVCECSQCWDCSICLSQQGSVLGADFGDGSQRLKSFLLSFNGV